MKALVKKYPQRGLWMEDVPEPSTGANDVKIKIHKTGLLAASRFLSCFCKA